MLVRIKRQKDSASKPYIEEFNVEIIELKTFLNQQSEERISVSSVIDFINEKLIKEKQSRIKWDCSCLESRCGACAMVVNGIPVLACECFLCNLKKKTIDIEPLKKFPVITDLKVDRSIIFENQKRAGIYLGEFEGYNEAEAKYQYQSAKCLKCGLCLEVCPNYKDGKNHFGAVMLNEAFILAANSKDRKQELQKAYANHFMEQCSSCMTCTEICPEKISTLASSYYMSRKLNNKK